MTNSAGADLAIKVSNLSVRYRGREVLSNVNAAFPAGSMTSLIGPSGCGKTTFLSCFNRLTDVHGDCRVAGDLRIGDENVFAKTTDVNRLRTRVGMIFQKPNPFPLSVWKNIALPLGYHGMRDKRRVAERVEHVLRSTGLWDEVKDRLHGSALNLSGGQQQRLCIARAIALEPKILLMDEPCSSLDPLSSAKVEEWIISFRGTYTVIIVTHNLAQARRIADQTGVFWLRDGVGTLIELRPTAAVFDDPEQPETRAYVTGKAG